jgi:hypothetical protein
MGVSCDFGEGRSYQAASESWGLYLCLTYPARLLSRSKGLAENPRGWDSNWLGLANWALRRAGLGPVAATLSEFGEAQQHQQPLSEYEWSIGAADNDILVHGSFPLSQMPEKLRQDFLSVHRLSYESLTEASDRRG